MAFNKCKEFGCGFFYMYKINFEDVTDAHSQEFFSTPAELFRFIEIEIHQAYTKTGDHNGRDFNEDSLPLRLIQLQICNTDRMIRDTPAPDSDLDMTIFDHAKTEADLL